MESYDVVIVGGGPAGLSAALVLGRCCRRVLVCDAGNPRNIVSHGVHGFLTRDGVKPAELLSMGRAELDPYDVQLREGTVMAVRPENGRFKLELLDGSAISSRKVLLATGVVDKLPQIPGIEDYYGKSVHHCPYCDGWEHRGDRLAVYGKGHGAAAFALNMKVWSPDIILCTDGPSRIPNEDLERLARHDVRIIRKRIARLEGTPPQLSRIVFEDGTAIDRTGLFFATGNAQRSDLLRNCGLETTRKGAARTSRTQRTNVPGLFVAGDAAEDSQYVMIAAAHGARAAMAINSDLAAEDLR